MTSDLLAFITYAYERHQREHSHRGEFESCPCRMCRRARQLEVYLILTGQWTAAAYGWLVAGGRG